jgi:guanosine-3',5'-bis(diphosphate) 3'-pyrophosphohydrolase
MTEEERYQRAFRFAEEKHKGQYRIGGQPYISHPLAVAEALKKEGYDTDYQITGLFHDLLEDTDAREEEIEKIGGSQVLDAVRRLTKTEGYVMADYIAGIREDPMAMAVKREDRIHNLKTAFYTDRDFRIRYIKESRDWYLDFSPKIKQLVEELEKTL